jgi:hypothetical protein
MGRWIERFERAGFAGRLALLAGGAVRLAATAAETVLDRAATIAVDAREAFTKELDPNVSDAKVIEEIDDRRPPRAS